MPVIYFKTVRGKESEWNQDKKNLITAEADDGCTAICCIILCTFICSIGKFIYRYMFKCMLAAAATAKLLQSCPTLCDPIDSSLLGSSVSGILQARILEWVAISFSNAWKWKVKVKSLSRARLLATPWTAAYPAPPFMGFSRQERWSGVPLPFPKCMLTNV